MKIELHDAIIVTETVSIYEVYLLIIDEEEKTIDCSDSGGMTIAMIHYENEKYCEILLRDYDDDRLNGNTIDLIKNGQLIYKGD